RRLLALTKALHAAPSTNGTRASHSVSELSETNSSIAALVANFSITLNDTSLDPAFREVALTLPSETMIAEQMEVVDPQAIHTARQSLRHSMAEAMREDFLKAYQENQTPGNYNPDAASAGKRGLKNIALSYISELDDDSAHVLMQKQCDQANNMTDRLAALTTLTNSHAPGKAAALAKFYKEFEKEALVIDKWFTLQAMAHTTDVTAVRKLTKHPAFTLKNPNRARSLIFSFCNGNPAQFHAADGSGYAFWAEQVIALNAINPQVAARLARSLDRWRKYAPALQEKMRHALQQVAKSPSLSNDVSEVITKSLAN
ncbi:MAG: aminopeptidase N C-terminal domain-containing protein, partial [Burkholderiaceae bacterium]